MKYLGVLKCFDSKQLFVVCCVAGRLKASNLISSVSDKQSVGSCPSGGTCVLEQDTLPQLLCPSDGTFSCRSHVPGLVVHAKEPR